MYVCKQIIAWLRVKHTSITQAVSAVIGAGVVLGWWDLTAEQTGAIMTLVAALWLIVGANTVTSNLRLTGRAFDAPSGVDVDEVAAYALGDLGSIPTPDDDERVADEAARAAGLG